MTGDSITRFDNQDTVWSTVVSGDSIQTYANGINLNMGGQGSRFNSAPVITLGASGPSGNDFVGEIKDLIIFRSALSDTDRALVRTHLSPPEVIISSLSDRRSGTLRQAIYDSPSNTLITFAPHLSGRTITITGSELSIGKNLTIDASSLPEGITINVSGQKRIFHIQPNNDVSLIGLTLTGGNADLGGAIYADGAGTGNTVHLRLSACTISGNSATYGGGIFSGGIFSSGASNGSACLNLSACTLSGNSAHLGGGIFSDGVQGSASLNLSACTLSGNSAHLGGGISNINRSSGSTNLSLSACTLSGNSAFRGGGIFSDSSLDGTAILTLSDTILAGNIADNGPDLGEQSAGATTIATIGNNLISSFEGSNIAGTDAVDQITLAPSPRLAPLGDYGGPTQTMLPLPGSPALDGAPSSAATTDQRGFPITDTQPDIGAVEAPDWSNPTPTELAWIFDTDSDGDGTAYGQEILLGTDPFTNDASHPDIGALTPTGRGITFGRDQSFNFAYQIDLYRSFDLSPDSFTKIFSYSTSNHTLISTNDELTPNLTDPQIIALTDSTTEPKAFYQLRFSNE